LENRTTKGCLTAKECQETNVALDLYESSNKSIVHLLRYMASMLVERGEWDVDGARDPFQCARTSMPELSAHVEHRR